MRITLNLATRPYADQGPAIKRLRIGMAVLAVVLLGLGLGLLHFHQSALRMAAQQNSIDQAIARIQREEQGYQAQMQQPANAKVLTQAGFLNGLFEEKSFSWTAAMEDLERVLPGGVQVTAIEPARGKDGRLTLHLRISGLRDRAVETVRNMEKSRRFVAPRIAGENAENSAQGELQQVRDSGKVSFDVLAEYNPATLDERKSEIAKEKRGHAAEEEAPAGQPASHPAYIPPGPQAGPRPGLRPGANPGSNPGPNQRPAFQPGQQPNQQPGQPPRRMPGGVPQAALTPLAPAANQTANKGGRA